MKSTSPFPQPEPTALCASFATVLPILDEAGLDAETRAQARAHLATCAYCQVEIAAYDQLDAAVRQSWGPIGPPRYQTEELLRSILASRPAESGPLRSVPSAGPASAAPTPAHPRRLPGGLPAVAALLVVVVLSAVIFSTHRLVTQTPPGGGSPNLHRVSDTELDAISMVSPLEGWAVGVAYGDITTGTPGSANSDHPADHVLLAHYLHGVWVPVHLAIAGQLTSISMDSATDGWAVGESFFGAPTGGIILHYNGQAWARAPFPDQRVILSQILMLGATDGWAIGTAGQSAQSSLWHYDGHVWAEQPLPATLTRNGQDQLSLLGLSMISATEGWMIGQITQASGQPSGQQPSATPITGFPGDPFQSFTSVILHEVSGRWNVQQTLPDTLPGSISMLSATDGWATLSKAAARVNSTPGTGLPLQFTPILLRYQHGQWVDVTSTIQADSRQVQDIGGVTMDSATDGWMGVGLHQGTTADPDLLLHYNGSVWSVVSLPTVKNGFMTIADIAMTSPTEGWAVGNIAVYQVSGYDQLNTPLILRYHNGVWSIFQR